MKQKFKNLVADDRTFKQRLAPALITAFALPFTFIIFGILDLYISNMGMFSFNILIILWPTILLGLICFAVLATVYLLLRGKLYNIAISASLGLLIAGYLQGMFMNLNLGQLTGDAINWGDYKFHSVINTIIWVVIILLPFILYYFSKNGWRKVVIFLPFILIGMQIAGLTSTAMQTDFYQNSGQIMKTGDKYISEAGMFEVSSKNNVIVFVLDKMDGKYIDQVNEDSPGYFDNLEGFTYYENNISYYARTYPSVAYLLTRGTTLFDEPKNDYFKRAYEETDFIPELRKNNFTTKVFVPPYETYGSTRQLDGIADNCDDVLFDTSINTRSIMKKMMLFSAYRYSPHVFKPTFWFSSDTFSEVTELKADPPAYELNDSRIYENLKEKGLTLETDKDNFTFLHMNGSHPPYNLDENGSYIGDGNSDVVRQTKGVFKILNEYFQKMKDLGVYDNATIIITGDHGDTEFMTDMTHYITTGLFVKPGHSAKERLKISNKQVSHENFHATVMEAAGIESDKYGNSIWDIEENATITRTCFHRVNYPNGHVEEYEVTGDARNFDNWKQVKTYPFLYDFHGPVGDDK